VCSGYLLEYCFKPWLDGVGDGPIVGIDGRSVVDFKSSVMFIGWDFPHIWHIDPQINAGMAHLVDAPNP